MAEQGASVVVNDIDLDEANDVVAEITAKGGTAQANDSDISTREGAGALIGQCVDAFGAIHAVVNNAGNVKDRSFLKMTDDEFMSVVRVHQGGTFMCSREGARRMREQGTGGAILNTVSAAHFGNFGQTNYAASISPSGSTRMSATYRGPDGKEVELPFIDPTRNGAFPDRGQIARESGRLVALLLGWGTPKRCLNDFCLSDSLRL
jgi:3-oxoacyl-[acyl-carrier protein] reductase